MAQKRMFTMKICDSDAFLDMPLSTQCLYFHLCMRADDDGFIGNPKRIKSLVGASEDDLKLLIAKRFVLSFEDGVIVIKHWKMHNYIQSDRYTPTAYIEEKKMLGIKSNKAYTLDVNNLDTECIQDVSTDLDLDLDQELDIEVNKEIVLIKEKVNYQQIADMYNEICISFPKLTKLSNARKKAIGARLKEYSIENFRDLFYGAETSNFLKGKNERNWSATFDWLLKDSNMAKVLDGNYSNKGKDVSNGPKSVSKPNELSPAEKRIREGDISTEIESDPFGL